MALHIDIPSPAQLATLIDTRAPDCVSIYLPTSPLPQDADQARIEFKNLVAEAGTANELLDDFAEDFVAWSLLAHSLAVFATPTSLRSFRLPNQLSSVVVTGDRFHVKPLLRAITFPQAALVLALSQNSVRLVEVAGDVPPSTIEVAGLEAVIAEQPLRYARQVDRALQPTLAGLGLPLILAAAEPLNSFYRAMNSYPELLEDGIAGNAEHLTEAELAQAARPILDALYAAELESLRARFEDWQSKGRAATDLTDVARAATFGAVDTLFVDIDTDGDQDVDQIARQVLASGGRVLAVRRDDVPHGNAAAALLRYAV